MKNVEKKSSGMPLVIIVVVLLLAVLAGWWFYNSSKSRQGTANRAANTANAARNTQIPANAPLGAQPPNMLGSPTALVTVEEFADFQCGSCAAVHPMLKQIQSVYGSRIKFIFRHFPLSMHDKAFDASVAAEAAGMQGRFWDMQNQLFSNQQAWMNSPSYKQMFADYAQKIALDPEKFQEDTSSMPAKQRVEADLARGRALGVNSTPTVYINGKSVPYPQINVESLRQIIDAELQAAAASQPQSAAPAANAPAGNPPANK